MRALFSGSFDPVTAGHLDIISRAADLFEELRVIAFVNSEKPGMFTPDERLDLLKKACEGIPNVTVGFYSGTVADYVAENKINVIVKGIRSGTDAEYEMITSDVNRKLCGVETLLLPCVKEYCFTSSTVVRDMIKYGKPFSEYIPEQIEDKIRKIIANRR